MTAKKSEIIRSLGRRKTTVARAAFHPQTENKLTITVNKKDFKDYFNYFEWQNIITSPLTLAGKTAADIRIRVSGGGVKAQAEAIRLAIARALVSVDEELRSSMKKAGFLMRDDRKKERKKPGLKRARRAPQWSKR